jgi:hypothetical protein
MAALALAAVYASGATPTWAGDKPVENQVNLQLQIAGLGSEGCKVEIQPGHAGCQFDKIEKTIKAGQGGGVVTLRPIVVDARSTGADRDCSFAITIKEPGQPARTVRRGLRLTAQTAGKAKPTQTLKVYLSAPSVAVRDGAGRTQR